jgi:uncharacterized protein (TIGR02284 family)
LRIAHLGKGRICLVQDILILNGGLLIPIQEGDMADRTEILDLLHDLIQTCKDGETGYTHAAGIATDPRLKAYFSDESLERARFVQELKTEAQSMGDDPDTSPSVAGTLHRVWFEAKADVGLGDQSILDSVEQGEDSAKKAYEKALSIDLPPQLKEMIQLQARSVFAAHDYVRDLRDHGVRDQTEGRKVA